MRKQLKERKQQVKLREHNKNLARTSSYFWLHFVAIIAPLRRETSQFHVFERCGHKATIFSFFFPTWIQSLRILLQKRMIHQHLTNLRW